MADSPGAVVVTGASGGIGAAVAGRLSADGHAVVVNYSGSQKPADEVVGRITASGGQALAVKADVGDAKAVSALFDAGERAFGQLHGAVNCAGLMKLSPMAEMSDEDWSRTIGVNLTGVFNGMREGARRLREGGRIVSFSSSVVGLYQPTYGAYAATKGAIEALTHILAEELGPRRISVNAVAPGPVATPLFLNGKSEDEIKPIVANTPLGRLGEPEDIARVVSFLIGPDGGWVSGQVLRANGGIVGRRTRCARSPSSPAGPAASAA